MTRHEATPRGLSGARFRGHGAVGLDGKMIDAASIRMAMVIVDQDRLIKARGGNE